MKNSITVLAFMLNQVKHIWVKMLQKERSIYLIHLPETQAMAVPLGMASVVSFADRFVRV